MGFAASQARFLSLTSRLSDVEYEAQRISQERLAIANQMAIYSDQYSDAMSNQVVVANVMQNNGQNNAKVTLTYDVIVSDVLNGGLGMQLINAQGLRVVPSEAEMQKQISEGNDLTPDDFMVIEDIAKSDVLQKNLEQGNLFLTPGKNDDGEWIKNGIEATPGITHVYDLSDDEVAKATYDKRMKKAESQDTALEMRLEQLETEHRAIETEMDSIDKVIDDGIENSFKTFG